MIIELTGVPGSGKSIVFNELRKELDNIIFVTKKSFPLEILFIFSLLFNYSIYKKYIFFIKMIFQSSNSFYHKINILRNTIIKLVLFTKYNDKDGKYLFDEGVSHIPFNIFVDSSSIKHCKSLP